jgi:Rieske Fe-S protein
MVLLMRFDPAALSAAEKATAPDGVVAYSAVCTHQQCWVTDCGGRVVGGPAPRPLPALPLKLSSGVLDVAAPFTDRVGGEKPQGA